MPSLNIILEALTSYKNLVTYKIGILENSTLDYLLIAHLKYTYDKIELLINDIDKSFDIIKLNNLKTYYEEYDINSEDIEQIKTIIRRINNRHYAKKSRDKKKFSKMFDLVDFSG